MQKCLFPSGKALFPPENVVFFIGEWVVSLRKEDSITHLTFVIRDFCYAHKRDFKRAIRIFSPVLKDFFDAIDGFSAVLLESRNTCIRVLAIFGTEASFMG